MFWVSHFLSAGVLRMLCSTDCDEIWSLVGRKRRKEVISFFRCDLYSFVDAASLSSIYSRISFH